MKLCLVLCAAAALADVTPPTISLSFPELAASTQHSNQAHANTPNVTLDAPGTLRNTQSYRSVTCEVGTSAADVTVCPKPTCTAWDHHDESNIACVPTYLLVNDDGTPVTNQASLADIKRGLRSEWLLKYDATDSSGNQAQTVSFTMIFQDTRVPGLTTEFGSSTWETATAHSADANGAGSRLDINKFTASSKPPTDATYGSHDWIEACRGLALASAAADYTAACMHSLSTVVTATDAYDGDVSNNTKAKACWKSTMAEAEAGCDGAFTTHPDSIAATSWEIDSHYVTADNRYWVVEYQTCDNAGIFGRDEVDNCAVQRNIISITDNTAPEITLNSVPTTTGVTCTGTNDAQCNIECRSDNSVYTDPGATCYDGRESWSTSDQTRTDKATTDTYTLDGTATANPALTTNQAAAATRIGFSLFPECDDTSCTTNAATEALNDEYFVHYNCDDGQSNDATEKQRTLTVVDTTPPVITLPSPHSLENSAGSHIYNTTHGFEQSSGLNMAYTGGGLGDVSNTNVVSCADSCDRDVFITATLHTGDTCDMANIMANGGKLSENWDDYAVGTYSIRYTCYDHYDRSTITHSSGVVPPAGKTTADYTNGDGRTSLNDYACRVIQNVDHTHPIIQILGSDNMILEATHEGNYVDDGAVCSDQVDGVISQKVEVSGDVVNLAKVGTYTVTYHCKDAAGNAAPPISRVVHVQHTTCPSCNVLGCANANTGCHVQHEASFPYVDPGATCSDSIDGTLNVVAKSGAACTAADWGETACSTGSTGVDTETTGDYVITYRAKNSNELWNDNKGDDANTDPATTAKSCAAHGPTPAANTGDGPKSYFRTVTVQDTLIPQMRITYDDVVVTHSANTDSASAWTGGTDTSTANTVNNVNREPPFSAAEVASDEYGNQDSYSLMAEATQGSGAWLLAAAGAAVAGVALLTLSQRRAVVSVPV